MNAQAAQIAPIFVATWIVLGIFSIVFFWLGRNAALKRKVHPPFVILVGVLFLAFAGLMGLAQDRFFYFLIVPAVILITVMNLRNTRFCNGCGRTIISQNPFTRPNFCSKCGAGLLGGNSPEHRET